MSDDLMPPPESEVKPQSLTEALAMPTGGKQLTLWGDVCLLYTSPSPRD